MGKRLTDRQLADLRRFYGEGVSQKVLASRFGLSQSHVSRLVRGERREVAPAAVIGPVRSALDGWLAGLELEGADRVRGRMLEVLASKADACALSKSAAAAAALPRVVGMLEEQLRLVAAQDGPPHLDVDRLLREVMVQ